MPNVSSDYVEGVMKGWRALYQESFDKTTLDWEAVAFESPSDTDQEGYSWVGEVPGMREWIDERVVKALKDYDYSIKNKRWESTIAVEVDAFEDRKLGQYQIRVKNLGNAAAQHLDELVFGTALAGADTALCFDGQYFIDTDHPLGDTGTTFSNKGTTALNPTSYAAARVAMRKFKNDEGRSMALVPTDLIVPPDLEDDAHKITDSEYVAGGTGGSATMTKNWLKGTARVIVSPHLTDTNNWFLVCGNKPIKPIILQMRKRPEFNELTNANSSDKVFFTDTYYFGVKARYNVGYSLPQLIFGSIVA
ncbi:MAG: Mu-like prophage major head subunit gpT family protein [Thermoleophilia bacterium]